MRRLAEVSLSVDAFGMLLQTGKMFEVTSGVRPSAKVVGAFMDWEHRSVRVQFEDEAYDPVPEGAPVPQLDMKLRTITLTEPETVSASAG